MEINGVNPQSAHVHLLGKIHPKDKQEPKPADQTSAGRESNTEQTTETSDAQGVIRLLQEGHFKGTSDVRLRINFYDKIAAIEAQQLQEVAEEKVDGILDSVNAVLGALVPEEESPPASNADPLPVANTDLQPIDTDSDGITDTYNLPNSALEPPVEPAEEQPDEVTQLQDIFTQTVTELKEDFLAAGTPSTSALLEGIQSAFDQLVESLQSALAPPEEPDEPLPNAPLPDAPLPDAPLPNTANEVIEPELAVESTSETPSLIDELTAVFKAAMDELTNGFDGVSVLPPLSEPNGNGAAYAKFLNIYNEMRHPIDQP